jgi:molybdopterin molybdotransferase
MSLLPIDEALRIIAESTPLMPLESAAPHEALGRPLAERIVSTADLPPFDNSAVDGYALHLDDIERGEAADASAQALVLRVAAEVAAGGEESEPLAPGETVRVMTGGRVPRGASAVVMREDVIEPEGRGAGGSDDVTKLENRKVERAITERRTTGGSGRAGETAHHAFATIRRAPSPGANIRRRGDEIRAGDVACDAGQIVNPGALGLLVSLGIDRVAVRRRPRVAVLATGNELLPAGARAAPGHIYDSSTPILSALVASAGALPMPLPIARDDRDELARAFARGLEHDVLISTGGVSVGDYDFTKEILASLGVEIRFWKVAMKPGKPLVYGVRGETRVFALPGNPGSSLATFERFVRPALRKMVGDAHWEPRDVDALADAPCKNGGDRTLFLRARAFARAGALYARPFEAQGSGTIRSLADCNAFIVLPPHTQKIGAGERVRVQLLPEVFGDLYAG